MAPSLCLHQALRRALVADNRCNNNVQDHLLEVLKPGLQERSYQDQEYLIRQGEQGTYMLYIMQGQVEVLLRLPSHTHRYCPFHVQCKSTRLLG